MSMITGRITGGEVFSRAGQRFYKGTEYQFTKEEADSIEETVPGFFTFDAPEPAPEPEATAEHHAEPEHEPASPPEPTEGVQS